MQLTRTPLAAYSAARVRARLRTAALEAEYTPIPIRPLLTRAVVLKITVAPSAAQALAVERPMPLFPPVMTAILFSSRVM